MWSPRRLLRLPIELRVTLAATVFLIFLNLLWAFNQAEHKIDPGTATLCGAIIGLAIIGYQARRGFANLIKSQRNQSELDREARVHKAEIERAEREEVHHKNTLLLFASIRAEIAALMGAVHQAGNQSYNMALLSTAMYQNSSPPSSNRIRLADFDAPVFKANINNLGLLGVSIAADVINVLSRARPGLDTTQDKPIPYDLAATIYASNYAAMNKWHNDLHHVAMRIIATESNQPNPGTLIETQEQRYKTLPSLQDLVPAHLERAFKDDSS